jgi:hypothetical protein
MRNTPRDLDFFASLHLTILDRPAKFDFFEQTEIGYVSPFVFVSVGDTPN